jgi:transcriptional regulator GlxA family with amidase domain
MTTVALVLYPGFTALDIVGPFQTLASVPGLDVFFVAEAAGDVTDDTGRFTLRAQKSFAEVTNPDVVVVPGGFGARSATKNDTLVVWLREVYEGTTWMTSVCTGAAFLALAGFLDGLSVTTHWAFVDLIEKHGATYTEQRVVVVGKIITAAGVSSGIDMGLTLVALLVNDEVAKMVQLAIEYDPQPPFDSGAPSKVTPEFLKSVRRAMGVDAKA